MERVVIEREAVQRFEVRKLLKMERETGFEPATSSLGSWHSTTELLPPGVTALSQQILSQSVKSEATFLV